MKRIARLANEPLISAPSRQMTYKTNARLAGFMFLFYTAATLAQGVLLGPIISGAGVAAKLANISQHVTSMSLVIVLSMVTILAALFLAVTLYAITRDEDGDLALLALCCRLAEGVFNVFPALAWTGLLWLGSEMMTTAAEGSTAAAMGTLLLKVPGWSTSVGAICFGVGSTLFSYLFLKARSIPVPLAWLGVEEPPILLSPLLLRRPGHPSLNDLDPNRPTLYVGVRVLESWFSPPTVRELT
jgi:hypothetical protein